VGAHHGEPYRLQVRYACEDIDLLRRRLRALERDIEQRLAQHQVGQLLTTIDGIGPQTAACIMAEVGDPARFASLSALASYVGVIPRLRESGKRKKTRTAPPVPLGNARLRRALWMPTLSAVRRQSMAARLLSATARGRQTRQSRAGGHAQVDGRSLQCRQTSPAIHAGACFSARRGRRGHPWRLASRKLYASVSETFLTGAHGI
jgi:transposase